MPVKIDNHKIDTRAGASRPTTAGATQGSEFKGVLKEARLETFNGSMRELIDQVKLCERFLKSPEEGLLNSYKESVKLLLKKLKEELFA